MISHGTRALRAVPGVGLACILASAATLLHYLPGFTAASPYVLAIAAGVLVRNVASVPDFTRPGLSFSLRTLLRIAIVLLGLQLSIDQLAAVGSTGIVILAISTAATFLFTLRLGRQLSVDPDLTRLIAAGTSICGASAILAANSVLRGKDEDVAYAIVSITLFGSATIVMYPLLALPLGLDAHGYGLWTGASVHEVAQVIATGFQHGDEAGEFATLAKLSRVMLLAPMIVMLAVAIGRTGRAEAASTRLAPPWFVIGFFVMIAVNSLDVIPAEPKTLIVRATAFLFCVAMAAMGLEMDLRKLRIAGWKPLVLGGTASLFISGLSLILIRSFYP